MRYNTDYDPINQDRWRKPNTSKHTGHDAGVAEVKKHFDTGTKTLKDLIFAQQVVQWQKELDSMEDSDDAKKGLQKQIEATKRKLSPEGRDLIQESQKTLQNRADALRKKLGTYAWSLRNYDEPVSREIMKELGIVPTMGKVIGRGQTGKDITR
jgi:hypothetical protein